MLLVRLLRLKPHAPALPRVMFNCICERVQFFLQAGPLASVTEKVTSTVSSSVQPKPTSRVFSRRNDSASSQPSGLDQTSLMSSPASNIDRQLDVSSPTTRSTLYTFIDGVESFLTMKNFALLRKSKGQNTGNFYRWTLTLAEVDGKYTLRVLTNHMMSLRLR